MLDTQKIRAEFPILQQEVYPGVPLVFLDSAASSQRPVSVLEAMDTYYLKHHANVHRGIYRLSEEASNDYEDARERIARFINAPGSEQVIYVRNATEGFNLVAYSWARHNLHEGDEILLTEMEHHANLVPWQMIAKENGIKLRFVPILEHGTLDLSTLPELLTEKTKLFSFTAVSNVLGTVNPVRSLVDAAHSVGALAMVDAAQAAPHLPVDVQAWDCDFTAFSGHKMCGPTGIGILYGKRELLEAMPPFMGGGDMILRVRLEESTYNELPWKFEAGTPAIAEAVGLGAAVDYLSAIGMEEIHAHEQYITGYALEALSEVPGLRILGPSAAQKGGVAAFTLAGIHPHDIAELLDKRGVAVRAGHHCAMPLHHKYGINASTRASFYLYTTTYEVDQLVQGLHSVREVFRL
ncbi:MAG: cysteine desulfurase [Candidatus Promineifilaceae bacterium]|jgi:cysteine desulfurase/selenocysteine lyase